jgi:NitT/TauT family transport system permease protein
MSAVLMQPLRKAVLPAIGVTIALALWSGAVHEFRIDPGILPSPYSVLRALKIGVIDGAMDIDIAFTVKASLLGFVAGSAAGALFGLLVGESVLLGRFVYPVILGAQSMPTIAIAPLLITWLGFEIGSKIVMVAVACFFPVFISIFAGMNAAPRDLLELYRVFSANRLRTLWEVKLPSALNYLFGGLQVAVVLSIIACIVSEFLASIHGLGHLIKDLSDQLDVSAMFAALVVLAALGALGTAALRWLHHRVVFWERAARVTDERP